MAGFNFQTFKSYIAAQFGWASGSATANNLQSLEDNVNRLVSRYVVYEIPQRKKVSVEWQNVWGQTISLSASQSLQERVIFQAMGDCWLEDAYFSQVVSATLSATDTLSWTCVLNRRGRNATTGTLSGTFSVTAYMAGLTSCTTKNGAMSHSQSALTSNVARAPNRFHRATFAKRKMTKGDIITFKVTKGSANGAVSGAIFQGGTLQLRIVEGS